MDREAGSSWDSRTADELYGAILRDEHHLLRTAAGIDDLYRWRDRLVAELARSGSMYARAVSTTPGTAWQPHEASPYAEFLDRWARMVAETIRRLQRFGAVAERHDPDDLATAILAAVHGGVLLARVTDDIATLRNALRPPFDQLVLHQMENGPH